MNILLASSEVYPYSKTGGLADMVGALGKALAKDGHLVRIVTPLYRGIRENHATIERASLRFSVPLGARILTARFYSARIAPGLRIYFLEQPEFYDRAGLYQEGGRDYPDNAARFIFFAKCVAQLARKLTHRPEIVHLHDWQAALAALLMRHQGVVEGARQAPATVMTIHNLAFQGLFPYSDYALTNLPNDYFTPEGVEFYGKLNCLKAGIVYADMVTTVSPRYAREITTEEYGCGLDGVLRARQDRLAGILNGVDYSEWNTENNPYLKFPYSPENMAGKTAQKLALQEEVNLPRNADIPLFGAISRLTDQKGIDIAIPALEEMLAARMQVVILGTGNPEFERAVRALAERYPDKAAARIGYDDGLAHRIEAGCDFFLMPSRFEPCGLNQMYSLRYGTIPIVRATGGLDDSVTDISEDVNRATGIKFMEYSARALAKAIRKALVLFENKELLDHYRLNAMEADHSWEHTTHDYERIYKRALEYRRG